jgi:hypothetical protein
MTEFARYVDSRFVLPESNEILVWDGAECSMSALGLLQLR